MSLAQVQVLIDRYTLARQLGVLGESRVQVLELNLALDMAKPAQPAVH
jgi:K+-transporting ATPase ATPase C chain